MIPEIGYFSLLLALCLCILQIFFPLMGIYQKKVNWIALARPLSVGQSLFVILSFFILMYSFYSNDFSVRYVAAHSNSTLPSFYKLSALWAGHEGSLLLWLLILSGWTLVVCTYKENKESDHSFISCFLAILGLISLGFLIFLLTTSNPFARYLPEFPLEGQDLNPLLQDFGLIIHPPILYLGYVGFSVPFAFAITCLLLKRVTSTEIAWVRSYTLCAFSFLTIGIALGSWWAYYELGWGGWWFWDPVENASFMPWLTAIALVHSLIVSDKRQNFIGTSLILAILCFILSLLGTFLVRSGILTSVHSFASDPKRGIVLLQFLFLMAGFAFILYGVRGKNFVKNQINHKASVFSLYSRESLLLISIALLLIATGTILLGTLFPIIYEIITHRKISVGFPYFNMVFVPLMIPLLCLVPLGPFTKWGKDELKSSLKQLNWALVFSIVLGIVIALFSTFWMSERAFSSSFSLSFLFSLFLGLVIGLWLCLGTLQRLLFKMKKFNLKGLKEISLGAWAMCLAHFGVGVMVIGIVVVSHFQIEREIKIAVSGSYVLDNYVIQFLAINKNESANTVGYRGHFTLAKAGKDNKDKELRHLYPEKRIFVQAGIAMSEAAIDPGFFRDIVIILGERLDIIKNTDKNSDKNTEFWSVRLYYKPFVRWIWLGALLIALGGVIGAVGKVRKKKAH